MPEIKVFLGSNLNFTIRVLTWDLVNDNACRKEYYIQFDQ